MIHKKLIPTILFLSLCYSMLHAQNPDKTYKHLISAELPTPGVLAIDYQYNFYNTSKSKIHGFGLSLGCLYKHNINERIPFVTSTKFIFSPKSPFQSNLYTSSIFYQYYWNVQSKKIIPSYKAALNYMILDPNVATLTNSTHWSLDNLFRINIHIKRFGFSPGLGLRKYFEGRNVLYNDSQYYFPGYLFGSKETIFKNLELIGEFRIGYFF